MANIIEKNGYYNRRLKRTSVRLKMGLAALMFSGVYLIVHPGCAAVSRLDAAPVNEMQQSRYVQDGAWGGSGVRLQVGRASTEIEYSCADGEIEGRLKLDSKGNFRAAGTHTTLRPGPVREGQPPPKVPAFYEGHVSGSRMTLKVTLSDTKEAIGTFELQKDAVARLHRCL